MNISLPTELKASIDTRARSGLYANATDVIRAGLRALAREELGAGLARFEEIMSTLPDQPITEEIEQEIERDLRTRRDGNRVKQPK